MAKLPNIDAFQSIAVTHRSCTKETETGTLVECGQLILAAFCCVMHDS